MPFEAFLQDISTAGFDARIASGGGRQTITMDRYDANWPMVARGWRTHVLGEGPQFANAAEAVRQKSMALHDQASRRMLQATLDMQRVLTPEQRQQLATRMAERRARMEQHMQQRQSRGGQPPAPAASR